MHQAAELREYLMGWKDYYRLSEIPTAFTRMDEWIRRRLMAIALKRWKWPMTISREMTARLDRWQAVSQADGGWRGLRQ